MTTGEAYLRQHGKSGDVIGFVCNEKLSYLINALSYGIPGWSISHVGILCEHERQLLIFHSLFQYNRNCVIQGKLADGAQAQLATDVLTDGCSIYHYPLYRALYTNERTRLRKNLLAQVGTPYDKVGAIRSGGWLVSTIEGWFRDEDKSALFCSEWVVRSLSDIGIFPTSNFSMWSPNNFVRKGRSMGILKKPVRVI